MVEVQKGLQLTAIDSCINNVLLSAPEAQSLLAPRFSVGKADSTRDLQSPTGTAQGHFFCRNQSAKVEGISGQTGLVGGPTGSLEVVTNYRTGQMSGFGSLGFHVGVSGVASANIFHGFIWGLNGNNSNYSGGFTNVSASIGTPIAHFGPELTGSFSNGSSVGGLEKVRPDGKVNAITYGGNFSLLSLTATGAGSVTTYSRPLQMGKQLMPTNITDLVLTAANHFCQTIGQ